MCRLPNLIAATAVAAAALAFAPVSSALVSTAAASPATMNVSVGPWIFPSSRNVTITGTTDPSSHPEWNVYDLPSTQPCPTADDATLYPVASGMPDGASFGETDQLLLSNTKSHHLCGLMTETLPTGYAVVATADTPIDPMHEDAVQAALVMGRNGVRASCWTTYPNGKLGVLVSCADLHGTVVETVSHRVQLKLGLASPVIVRAAIGPYAAGALFASTYTLSKTMLKALQTRGWSYPFTVKFTITSPVQFTKTVTGTGPNFNVFSGA